MNTEPSLPTHEENRTIRERLRDMGMKLKLGSRATSEVIGSSEPTETSDDEQSEVTGNSFDAALDAQRNVALEREYAHRNDLARQAKEIDIYVGLEASGINDQIIGLAARVAVDRARETRKELRGKGNASEIMRSGILKGLRVINQHLETPLDEAGKHTAIEILRTVIRDNIDDNSYDKSAKRVAAALDYY